MKTKNPDNTNTKKDTTAGKKNKSNNPDSQTFSDDPAIIDQALQDSDRNKKQPPGKLH
ncbi:hypothetical protein [Niabella aquatica]